MTAREELIEMIWDGAVADRVRDGKDLRNVPVVRPKVEALADAILAAGYCKPRTITTVAELDALPDMSAVLDDMDGPLTRFCSWWRAADGAQFHSLDVVLPATVLYEPEPQP